MPAHRVMAALLYTLGAARFWRVSRFGVFGKNNIVLCQEDFRALVLKKTKRCPCLNEVFEPAAGFGSTPATMAPVSAVPKSGNSQALNIRTCHDGPVGLQADAHDARHRLQAGAVETPAQTQPHAHPRVVRALAARRGEVRSACAET